MTLPTCSADGTIQYTINPHSVREATAILYDDFLWPLYLKERAENANTKTSGEAASDHRPDHDGPELAASSLVGVEVANRAAMD